ncbi:MAG: helix-turn-helix transcriptional regulator [Novosphingobium sp.]|nr:helix-turn-helix transcriptional regulator [Novosphingobium sp.]
MSVRAETDPSDLVQPLIDGMFEDPMWSTFLGRLRVLADADYTSLVFRPLAYGPERNRVVHLYSGQPSPPVVSKLYHDSLHLRDPMPYLQMEDGRVYPLAELLRFGDPDHDSYRTQFLIPSGMNILRMMRVVEPGGVSAWITVSRRNGEFNAEVDDLISSVGPTLRGALRSYVAYERERTRASVASEAIRRMNFGWLTLDGEGTILDADTHGAKLLEESNVLGRGRGGRLVTRAPAVGREISATVKALLNDLQARPRAIVLSRDPWLDMLLVSANIRAGAARPAPAVIAYVHADHWTAADRCDQLSELFDLIPSEARLALALSRGMSIAEAAADLGLTVESARTYSKRIYAKTGARGQADLVRFVHRSVLSIA